MDNDLVKDMDMDMDLIILGFTHRYTDMNDIDPKALKTLDVEATALMS